MSGAERRGARRLPLALRFALRDLIGDPRGFGIFIACIVIGVATVSGVSALSRSLAAGLAKQGRVILGGDVSFNLVSRELEPDERAFLEKHGRLSQIALMRAMARTDDGEAALVEIKAVEADYPSFGRVELDPDLSVGDALAIRNGVAGLAADTTLMARLGVRVGDALTIGATRFELRAVLLGEPDKLAGGVGFGARALMNLGALRATGLVQPGSIVRWRERVALGRSGAVATDEQVSDFVEQTARAFPQAGWDVRKRDAVSPQFSRNLGRFMQFLTLVALTALVAGGAGIANAVAGFIARKRDALAILKALGAPASRVFAIAFTQILLVAAAAIATGSLVGASLPFIVAGALRRLSDIPIAPTLDFNGLAIGALYGLLVTLVFALGPLGRAHDVSVATLLRDVELSRGRLPSRYAVAIATAVSALLATIMISAADKLLAASYIVATGAAFLLLRLVASGVAAFARALSGAANMRLRFALANIRRPHSLTPALVVSIGLTQTLLVALALVEGAIHAELTPGERGETPSFFFVDVPKSQTREFLNYLGSAAPGGRIEHVPMMRGRIVAINGARAETVRATEDAAWALEGDRGITFSQALPKGSTVVAGSWWDENAAGQALVSLEARIAEGLGLSIGDEITVNVLGRDIRARIANLRKVDWLSFGINFVLVFSPGVFAEAPHSELVTVAFDNPDAAERDARLIRDVAGRFPSIASLRVKDALETIDRFAGQLALAARAAAAIAIITATLALASAIAAGQRARLHDAVVLKTLGATRPFLAGAYLLEFALLGATASVFSLIAGSGAAYLVVEKLMKMDFVFRLGPVAATVAAALIFTILLGLAGTWRILGHRPGPELRRL